MCKRAAPGYSFPAGGWRSAKRSVEPPASRGPRLLGQAPHCSLDAPPCCLPGTEEATGSRGRPATPRGRLSGGRRHPREDGDKAFPVDSLPAPSPAQPTAPPTRRMTPWPRPAAERNAEPGPLLAGAAGGERGRCPQWKVTGSTQHPMSQVVLKETPLCSVQF